MSSLEPKADRVVVRRDAPESVTKAGIILPEAAKQTQKMGTVVAVGPGTIDERGEMRRVRLDVGDRVLFSAYAGTEVKVDGDEYLILNENEILACVCDGAMPK